MQQIQPHRNVKPFISGSSAGGTFKSVQAEVNKDTSRTFSKPLFGIRNVKGNQFSAGDYGNAGDGGNNNGNIKSSRFSDSSPSGPNKKKGEVKNYNRALDRKLDPKKPAFISNEQGNGQYKPPGGSKSNNKSNRNGGPNMPSGKPKKVWRSGSSGTPGSEFGGSGTRRINDNQWNEFSPTQMRGSASWFSVNVGQPFMEFVTHVKSGLSFNESQERTDTWSPLYIQSGQLYPPETVAIDTNNQNYMTRVIWNDVYYEYLNLARLNINKLLDTQFTQTKWYNYTYWVCVAIQLYYMMDRVQAYMSDGTNRNIAVRHLHEEITPSGWNAFSNLKITLSRQYLHPNMLKFIAYMYQFFTPSDHSHGPVYCLGYMGSLHSGSGEFDKFRSGQMIENVIFELNKSENNEMASYLARSVPNWRLRELPASVIKPMKDNNWLTFWTNTSVSYEDPVDVKLHYTKTVTAKDQNVPYYLHADDVDGTFYACNTIMLDNGPGITPYSGMWMPFNNFSLITSADDRSSLIAYKKIGAIEEFSPLRDPDQVAASGIANAIILSNGLLTVTSAPMGTKPAIVSSIDNMSQAANEAFRYLLYPSSES